MALETQRQRADPAVHNDEGTLVARVSNGDPAALEILYDRYSSMVFTLATRIAANRAEAEEITLETFSQLWKQAAHFDPARGSVASWLFMMARNRAIHALRSRGPNAGQAGGPPPQQVEEETERCRAVRSALAELPAFHREALELAYYCGLSSAEIAARTGQPLGTIKAIIAQSMTRLRALSANLEA